MKLSFIVAFVVSFSALFVWSLFVWVWPESETLQLAGGVGATSVAVTDSPASLSDTLYFPEPSGLMADLIDGKAGPFYFQTDNVAQLPEWLELLYFWTPVVNPPYYLWLSPFMHVLDWDALQPPVDTSGCTRHCYMFLSESGNELYELCPLDGCCWWDGSDGMYLAPHSGWDCNVSTDPILVFSSEPLPPSVVLCNPGEPNYMWELLGCRMDWSMPGCEWSLQRLYDLLEPLTGAGKVCLHLGDESECIQVSRDWCE